VTRLRTGRDEDHRNDDFHQGRTGLYFLEAVYVANGYRPVSKTEIMAWAFTLERYPSSSRHSNGWTGQPIGSIPPAEAEERYYAMLEQPAMAA
jgi:hypothetical protein